MGNKNELYRICDLLNGFSQDNRSWNLTVRKTDGDINPEEEEK